MVAGFTMMCMGRGNIRAERQMPRGMNIIPADYFSLRISPFRRILATQP
jgi:hypothetical protein